MNKVVIADNGEGRKVKLKITVYILEHKITYDGFPIVERIELAKNIDAKTGQEQKVVLKKTYRIGTQSIEDIRVKTFNTDNNIFSIDDNDTFCDPMFQKLWETMWTPKLNKFDVINYEAAAEKYLQEMIAEIAKQYKEKKRSLAITQEKVPIGAFETHVGTSRSFESSAIHGENTATSSATNYETISSHDHVCPLETHSKSEITFHAQHREPTDCVVERSPPNRSESDSATPTRGYWRSPAKTVRQSFVSLKQSIAATFNALSSLSRKKPNDEGDVNVERMRFVYKPEVHKTQGRAPEESDAINRHALALGKLETSRMPFCEAPIGQAGADDRRVIRQYLMPFDQLHHQLAYSSA